MRLKLGARKSDLARLQAYLVADTLKSHDSHIDVDFYFRESLGDKNLTDPLWKIPEKGVFTQDFFQDLVDGTLDFVVHSWKDLPTDHPEETEIVATLPRADMRDLLIMRKDRWEKGKKDLQIFSSSPRRAYNLEPFLKEALPGSVENIRFESVRGNVPTRFRKTLEGDVDGLILAKAALDRLLTHPYDEFKDVQDFLRSALEKCHFMVLPISENPPAAAQGALAIEIRKDRKDLRKLFGEINHEPTFQAANDERKILASYGGGCHQKIGVGVLVRDYGKVTHLRGETDRGEVLEGVQFETKEMIPSRKPEEVFPLQMAESKWFERESLDSEIPKEQKYLFVARANSLPEGNFEDRVIWCSGVESWKKLAKRGLWVTGCQDSLGEQEPTGLETLVGETKIPWLKLTHEEGSLTKQALFTYRLRPIENPPSLEGKKSFFWASGSSFRRALELFPWLKDAEHFCGPGNTYGEIAKLIPKEGRLIRVPGHGAWLKAILRK